jgi:hypothetical protein
MAANEKSRNLHQSSRLTRDLVDKVCAFRLAQPFQRIRENKAINDCVWRHRQRTS